MSPEPQQRLFFAVLLSEALLEAAVAAQQGLRPCGADVKWVEPENLHFTLKFLGDTPASRIPALTEVAAALAAQTPPLAVMVQGLGYFPPERPPQVIWAGCAAGAEQFAALGQGLDAALAAAGLAELDRRPFVPHLTLGRVRGRYRLRELADAIRQNAELDLGPLTVDRFLLISSQLEPQGPVYTKVESFNYAALGRSGVSPDLSSWLTGETPVLPNHTEGTLSWPRMNPPTRAKP